jgi:hypothetical protein
MKNTTAEVGRSAIRHPERSVAKSKDQFRPLTDRSTELIPRQARDDRSALKGGRMKVEGRSTVFRRPIVAYVFCLLISSFSLLPSAFLFADAPVVPPDAAASEDTTAAHQGYAPPRYQELWTKSPFAVETPDENVTESAEYSLVGIAQLDGVTYASLIEKQNQDHILLSSDKPLNGLSLNSVTQKEDGTYATLSHNGELITIKLEVATASVAVQPSGVPANYQQMPGMPGNNVGGQNIPMPGTFNPSTARPFIRIRRPLIRIPPPASNQAPGQPGPPPNAGP